MSRPARGQSRANVNAAEVREEARGRWPYILQALSICVPSNPRKGAPCPTCGGRDRFHFDDLEGRGTWLCRHCVPQAGDGFRLVMNVNRIDFRAAIATVGAVLGLDRPVHIGLPRPLPPPPLIRVDRHALAFTFQLAALDKRLSASKIQDASKHVNTATLSDEELDHALALVKQSHELIERAEMFEAVADGLRLKAYQKRSFDGEAGR